ncbi:hypothetical protein AB3Y40_14000 [Yoonia sp. R2331]|uniref:hypothetical protein n=1 Tax=Yoonia sp. R2331 TaxID=3237238 RepID=UPI0034E5199C
MKTLLRPFGFFLEIVFAFHFGRGDRWWAWIAGLLIPIFVLGAYINWNAGEWNLNSSQIVRLNLWIAAYVAISALGVIWRRHRQRKIVVESTE